jgi:hypothetical protein
MSAPSVTPKIVNFDAGFRLGPYALFTSIISPRTFADSAVLPPGSVSLGYEWQ